MRLHSKNIPSDQVYGKETCDSTPFRRWCDCLRFFLLMWAYLNVLGLHNKKMALRNVFFGTKIVSNTSNQNFHPQWNIEPWRCFGNAPFSGQKTTGTANCFRELCIKWQSLPFRGTAPVWRHRGLGNAPAKLFNSLENSLHMTHFRDPQVLRWIERREGRWVYWPEN